MGEGGEGGERAIHKKFVVELTVGGCSQLEFYTVNGRRIFLCMTPTTPNLYR